VGTLPEDRRTVIAEGTTEGLSGTWKPFLKASHSKVWSFDMKESDRNLIAPREGPISVSVFVNCQQESWEGVSV
jgi:hypothetical protein